MEENSRDAVKQKKEQFPTPIILMTGMSSRASEMSWWTTKKTVGGVFAFQLRDKNNNCPY